MNIFRKLVSGRRRRFKQGSTDLDITYVTNRVMGMSFPASGMEQIYRNNINDVGCFLSNSSFQVANFLEKRHKDAYLIINLSNRKYDYKKFNN